MVVAVREFMRVFFLAMAIVLLGGSLAKGLAKREEVPEPVSYTHLRAHET